jgi:large subunit ribosomal protein L22
MPVTVKLRYLRIAPRKVRLVTDLIRQKKVEEAQTILNFTTKKAARVLLKLLKQAVSNAKTNFQLEEKNLYISKVLVDEGPKYKRWRPRARGMAFPIQKKTSHVTIVLDELAEAKPKRAPRLRSAIEKKPRKVKEVEKVEKAEKVEEVKKVPKVEKAKFKPEVEAPKPKIETGLRPHLILLRRDR